VQLKKLIKYLLALVIVLLIGKIVFKELFDNRPFKFEKYKTSEQLEAAAKLRFPIGSDLDLVVNDLEKSGADCYIYKHDKLDKCENIAEYDVECEYITSLFSLHPLEDYSVWSSGDKGHKLAKLGAQRVSGLMLIIP
jgi:hypothetical protein